jgi:hypothetical protein
LAGLSDPFRHWLPPTEGAKVSAVTNGLVVLDTNVLLDAYRFAARARDELFEALEKLGDRLWVPYQVALEFHKNRVGVITEHDATYREALTAISDFRDQINEELGNKIQQLSNRVALSDEENSRLKSLVVQGLNQAIHELGRLKDRHGIPEDAIYRDPVLERLQGLLLGKVGSALSEADETSARKEAKRRIDEKIPPGYEDRKKADPCGDYLFWFQTLQEAAKRKVPLLIVTRDVKDDWFWKSGGKTIGARSELVEECQRSADVPFILMTTRTFLYHAARHLRTQVSDDTLRQVDALPPPHDKGPARLTRVRIADLAEKSKVLADSLLAEIRDIEARSNELSALLLTENTDSENAPRVQKMLDRNLNTVSHLKRRRLKYLVAADELRRVAKSGAGAKIRVPESVIAHIIDDYDIHIRSEQNLLGEE